MDLQAIIALRKYLSIDEHKDGEISLNISLKVLADNKAMAFVSDMKKKNIPKAILDSNLDIIGRKVKLTYDTKSIVPSEFDEILTTRNRTRFEELVVKYEKVLSV